MLELNRRMVARSDRVKALDFHPTEPWVLAALYNGTVQITNYTTGALVKSFDVAPVPVRTARFVARKHWFVAGADDNQLRVYNYNTSEKVAQFEAHPDYIRCLAVHPTLPLVLTGSDDMSIRLFDWDKNWKLVQTFEGHTHYIMHLVFNPKDSNTFASASIDRTVKVWTIGAGIGPGGTTSPNYTLDAHERGVNYVDYYPGSDKPYLITCSDDKTIKVWDYLTKSCVQTLEGHAFNVSFAIYHPSLPVLLSGAEDGTVRVWDNTTYRTEALLDYGLERCWCAAVSKSSNDVALGYDNGLVVVKIGKEEPVVSMDQSGKVIYAKNLEVHSANVGALADEPQVDGQALIVPTRELGNLESYAQALHHSPNGRFVTAVGDGEYIVYTALAWRNKAFGPGSAFAWSHDSTTYAVKTDDTTVKVFRNFKEREAFLSLGYVVTTVFGGALLSVIGDGFVCFYDWDTGALVRRIDVEAKQVSWSRSGELVSIVGDDLFFVLRYNPGALEDVLASGQSVADIGDEGVEDSFDVVTEVSDPVRSAKWTEECLIYSTTNNKLQYLVGDQTYTISHTDTELYILGYLPSQSRVYVVGKDLTIYSYSLSLAMVQYQTLILQGEKDAAAEMLQDIPDDQLNRVARFLEGHGEAELALSVAQDPDQRFELAITLEQLDVALGIARAEPAAGSEAHWRTLGDKALARWDLDLAQECFTNAGDVSALLLLGVSKGDGAILERVVELAKEKEMTNVAFSALLQLGQVDGCIALLQDAGRTSEAALFARTFAPSRVPALVNAWKDELASTKRAKQTVLAEGIANPADQPDLFPEGWQHALSLEQPLSNGH